MAVSYRQSVGTERPFSAQIWLIGYIRDERSGVESYPYPVNEGQRYINLNSCRLFVQQPLKKGKGSRESEGIRGNAPGRHAA